MKTIAVLVTAVLLLAGCSGASDDPAPGPTPTDASTSLDQQAQEQAEQTQKAQDDLAAKVEASSGSVKIVIKDGKVTPQGGRVEVKVGQPVTLEVSSDADEEIHVHSEPEHSYEIAAGEPFTETFTIDAPGQVAIEAHHLDVTIVQLVVRP